MSNTKAQWRLDRDVGLDDIPDLLAEFAEFLRRHRPEVVICDVSEVRRPSKGALEALSRLSLTAKRHDAQLVLTGIGPPLMLLLRITGMDDVLA